MFDCRRKKDTRKKVVSKKEKKNKTYDENERGESIKNNKNRKKSAIHRHAESLSNKGFAI